MRPSLNPLPFVRALLLALIAVTALAASSASGQGPIATYRNPVIPGDFADPSVIRVGDTYYAAGTSSEWAPFYPLYQSRDLVSWQQFGHVFTRMPEWAAASYWAPELFHHNGTFFVYYTARRKSDNVSVIGVATTDDPRKGFGDRGIIVEWGKEAIDGFPFRDDDGRLYLAWKAYGLADDNIPTALLASEMTPDGLALRGKSFTLLEGGYEGEAIVKREGWYYLFYSSRGCCGRKCDYQLEVARARDLRGPWTQNDRNPLLRGGGDWRCPGHGTPVQTPDGRWFYMYHAYHARDFVHVGRQGLLDELNWSDSGWPFFKYGDVPSVQAPTPVDTEARLGLEDFFDDFTTAVRPVQWQWDFRHPPTVTTQDGALRIAVAEVATGSPAGSTGRSASNGSPSGTFYGVAPARGRYAATATVEPGGAAVKGVAAYGDANNALGLGVSAGRLVLWRVEKGQRHTLAEQALSAAGAVHLRMEVWDGRRYRFSWSTDGRSWTLMRRKGGESSESSESAEIDGDYLPPWDRAVRAGLFVMGEPGASGVFDSFRLGYGGGRRAAMTSVARPIAFGMAIVLAGTIPRNILFAANLRIFPAIPWAVLLAAFYLWFFWRYLHGDWPRDATASDRRASLRAHALPVRVWTWALLAGGLGIVGLVLALRIANHFIALPEQTLPSDLARVPPVTMVSLLLAAAPIAGIIEEAAFRGYMQGPIERRYGLVIASLITGTMFAIAHLDFTWVLWPYYVAVAAIYGTVTYLTNSILPAIVLHTAGNLYSNLDLWLHGRAEWQTGVTAGATAGAAADRALTIPVAAFAIVTIAMLCAYARLARTIPIAASATRMQEYAGPGTDTARALRE
jgi:xylan 1,4-beta-xylosidase